MVNCLPMGIRSVPVVEAKARFSALLAEVEVGMEVRITRRGRTVARLVPEPVIHAASLFKPFWADPPPDLAVPDDSPPESAPDLG
jgi:prevent-host-death family protein